MTTDTKPTAFEDINKIKSYWFNTRKFSQLADKLNKRLPGYGRVLNLEKNYKLETFREAQNCYYDLYNNGLCNLENEFREVFGLDGMTAEATTIERKMDQIVRAAAKEQKIEL